MGIVSNGSFWIYDAEELRSQDPNWPTHEGWGEIMFAGGGQQVQSFVIPDEVRSISVCLIAGGGLGYVPAYTSAGNTAGGGGQLVYMNDIPVTPGDTYYINTPYIGYANYLALYPYQGQIVGFGTSANIMLADLVALPGMDGRYTGTGGNYYAPESIGATEAGIGGGHPASVANAKTIVGISQTALDNADGGGLGGNGLQFGCGGAGGYTGNGGNGAPSTQTAGSSGQGGGGSGGASSPPYPEWFQSLGGGVFPFGQTTSGTIKTGNRTQPARFSIGQGPSTPVPYNPSNASYYGNYGLSQSGSYPTSAWPQYITDPRGSAYQNVIDPRVNIALEHGFGFGSNYNVNIADKGKTAATGGTNINFSPKDLWCARIVWPGNARKFPSQHVYYVPNPGSTWTGIYDNLNGYVYSRDDLITTGYSKTNGYTGS
jgi:hypothetical protein